MGAYKSPAKVGSKSGAGDFKEADGKTAGFKKGGKAMKKDERPARKSGGGVFSSASGAGTPRGKASHY